MRLIDTDRLITKTEIEAEGMTEPYKSELTVTVDWLVGKTPTIEPDQQWVLCSTKLPEYGEAVLTCMVDGDYNINHIIDEDNGEWFYDGVLAWMPLPQPYKGGQE
jgi:hypothetical protein